MRSSLIYTISRILALIGLLVCLCFRFEELTTYNLVCLFYVFCTLMLFEHGVIEYDSSKLLFGIPCWLGLMAAESVILIGIDFWFVPLVCAFVLCLYYLVISHCYALQLNLKTLLTNAWCFLLVIYLVFVVIKVLIKFAIENLPAYL